MIQNVLPAVIAGFVRNFKIEDMRLALETFIPSPTQTPGRMNMFQFKDFQIMVDYAHNTAGFTALGKFVEKMNGSPKVGIIAGVGDRREEDTVSLGRVAAKIFDEIIIRQDKNLRGRSDQEIIDFILKGIHEVDKNKPVKVIPSEAEAITYAIKNGKKGSFITICSDVVPAALDAVMKYKEEEDKFVISKDDIPNQKV